MPPKTKAPPPTDSFAGVEITAPPGLMDQLVDLVDQLRTLESARQAAELELSRITAEQDRLLLDLIPDAMQQIGLAETKLADGAKLTLKDDVNVSIRSDNKPAAYAWLREQQLGSIIKSSVIIDMRALDDDTATRIRNGLDDDEVEYTEEESVHAATLKATIKSMLEKGTQPPPSFNIHQFKKAVLKEPRK